jgi:hypothetical protein
VDAARAVGGSGMSPVMRGFRGRRRPDADPARVPPGQYVTPDFPVLSAGPTPHTPLDVWTFAITGAIDDPKSWTWEDFRALPSEQVTVDIHCVTKWSKLDTTWTRVSVDTLLAGVETSAEYVTAFSDGGTRRTARARARRSCATARPPSLLLEERQVGPGSRAQTRRRARLLGELRLSQLRRPMARAAVLGRLSWQLATVVKLVDETPRVRSIVLDPPQWQGQRAGQHVDVRLTAEDGSGPAELLDRLGARGRAPGARGGATRRRRGLAIPGRRAASW